VPVTKIILQGFRSLSAAQVQRRRERLHTCTHSTVHTHMQDHHVHLHTDYKKTKTKPIEVNSSLGAQLNRFK